MVGIITKNVRNNAKAIITWFGGACAVPIAVRRNESTTTIRVNEVTITRIDGASDRIVISIKS